MVDSILPHGWRVEQLGLNVDLVVDGCCVGSITIPQSVAQKLVDRARRREFDILIPSAFGVDHDGKATLIEVTIGQLEKGPSVSVSEPKSGAEQVYQRQLDRCRANFKRMTEQANRPNSQ